MEARSDLWWKSAIIYCIDVASFLDTNGDGIGDLEGVTRSIDYLAGLGVTCLWLMPFYPSPERDAGYDVADYYTVDQRYGSAGDLVELVQAATDRGIRVICDLVVNHTSTDHPWFQRARRGDPTFRDFYVWSKRRPANAGDGAVFPGHQDGTWSYDRSARAWYMHRFYEFQPDLNINNPLVRAEIHKVIGFWLELGVSGFRVDAVPFMIERKHPDHPAVRNPHDYLRDIRDFASRRQGDSMLLAEANEPLERIGSYFGDRGNQMNMLFNFLVNQALYLGFVRQSAVPVAETLCALPDIPHEAQWAFFLKNHDEQSLDKLSSDERDEVYRAFAPRPSMRLYDRGIRRRFPSMVDGDRRRMELAYSLLLSLPGTPVLLYGEEIGMGDNQRLPDREAVRIPMQWANRPGGGFTTADPATIHRKPMRDGPFGYERVNVEDQRRDDGSLLNWMELAIRTRKEWPEIGWGRWRVLGTRNPAVLAHVATYDGSSVLAVHNFSSEPARATIRLPRDATGGRWQHILGPGDAEAPPEMDAGRLSITVEPYGYHWFGRREGV